MKYLSLLLILISLSSCNRVKDKTKETVNKAGEVVAKTGSEFVDGVSKGVEETFRNEIALSEELQNMGLKTGKILINSSDSAQNNVLTVYMIFDKKMVRDIVVKVFDEHSKEYGRSKLKVSAEEGEAKYFDFVFDKRTHIESKGKIIFE